jgi:hypothetical protein
MSSQKMTTKFGGFAPSVGIAKSKTAAKERKGFMRQTLSREPRAGNGGFFVFRLKNGGFFEWDESWLGACFEA